MSDNYAETKPAFGGPIRNTRAISFWPWERALSCVVKHVLTI